MIPDNSKKKLEQLRQEMARKAQLSQQYDKEMAARYTRDMPSFTEWMAKQPQGKAEGGKIEPTQDEMRLALTKNKRHGMYSPLEKLAIDIPRAKGTGAEFMAEISKRPGFKPEEVADRKIPIPKGKMTKAEFLEHLQKHSNPPLHERVLHQMTDDDLEDELRHKIETSGYDSWSEVPAKKYSQWKEEIESDMAQYDDPRYNLPGSKNYREILLSLPKRRPDASKYRDPAKYDADLRAFNASGQEDFHSSHWKDDPNVLAHMRLSDRTGPKGEKLLHLEELQSDWHQHGRKKGYLEGSDRGNLKEEMKNIVKERGDLVKAFTEHQAKFGEITPEMQNKWNEFKSREDALESKKKEFASKVPDAPFKKSWHELGMKHVLHHAAKNGYQGVVITPGEEQARRWSDEGLKVHYDKKIPEFLNKFGKPHGVQVGSHPIEVAPAKSIPQVAAPGINYFPEPVVEPARTVAAHHFPITEPMRTSILKEGMPQYMRGGVVNKAEGGAVLPLEKIKAQMLTKGLSSLQSIGAEEAPSLGIKAYIPPMGRPDNGQMPVGGVDTSRGDLPIGGIDMSKMQPGQQLMQPSPAGQQPGMDQVPAGDKIPTMDGTGMPPAPNANPNQMGSNILSMTPQGQAMAAMKPQGLAKGGAVNMARGGMPFAIKAPQELPKAPDEFTPYDDSKPSIPSLSKAFDEAMAHHLSLSPEDRMINSQRAAMAVAKHTGMTSSGKPKDLLGQNEKLLKSGKGYEGQEPVKLPDGRGVETTGLALAPAYEEGNFNTCPNHHSCKAECLGKTSGNYFKLGGGQDLSEFKGPRLNSLLKTNAFLRDPHAMAVKLYDEIDSAKQMAAANGNHLGVRLNVLSDINPRVHKAIIEAHPDVTFYDYTKNNTNPIAPNHHYTYSSTGVSQPGVDNQHTNWKQMRRRLDQGDNVAMAFSHKDHLPETIHDQETGKKYKVIDGDTHDFRPLDLVGEGEDGVIVGLKNKKATGKMDEAHIDSKGFFLHYDPQLKMSTNAKGQPVYARTASNRISEKTGKPMLGETIPQNRTVNIQPQTRGMIPLTNDGEKQ